jgi:natural product precursor
VIYQKIIAGRFAFCKTSKIHKMEKREFKKKLKLNKESITSLNNSELNSIKGGYPSNNPEHVCNTKSVRMRCCAEPSAEFSCTCDQIFSVFICT